MLSSFLFVRHRFLGPVGSHPPGQTGRLSGVPTIPPAKENDFRQGCISLLLRGSIWRCRGSLWRSLATLSTAFLNISPIGTASAFCLPTMLVPVCLCAGRQAQGQADWQAGWQGCQPGSRQAGRPFRLQRKGTFSKVVSLCRCVAAFGVVVAACGVLYPALSPFLCVLTGIHS